MASPVTGPLFLGVDVGTNGVRAGAFDSGGALIAHAAAGIDLVRGAGARAEYSSQDIWQAVCAAVRQVCGTAGVSPAAIAGIGFDATCSLVVRDADGAPLPVGATDGAVRDTIAWLDHRAVEQADRINRGAHPVLRYVGGRISPEMQMPKLLWLKENCPDTFRRAAHFFDREWTKHGGHLRRCGPC